MLESRHFSATGYLFIYAAFYYAFVSSACTRRLSPLPLPSIPAVGSIANSLLIFFFFVKKKFKKFRFDTWTCWFEKYLIESFVRLVAFCFTIRAWNVNFERLNLFDSTDSENKIKIKILRIYKRAHYLSSSSC